MHFKHISAKFSPKAQKPKTKFRLRRAGPPATPLTTKLVLNLFYLVRLDFFSNAFNL